MVWTSRAASFFRLLFRRRRLEDELDEEMRSCFEMLVDRNRAQGMAPHDARRAARLHFEGVERVKEKVRDGFPGWKFELLRQDLRYALRALRRTPLFASIAVLTLALGIGVNTAVFSVAYAVLMRPLPYDHSERAALIWASFHQTGANRAPVSGVILDEVERRSRTLESTAGIWVTSGVFTGTAEPEQVKVAQVSTNFFQTLGVHAALGRVFLPEERSGGRPVIVISDGLWRSRFGADPHIVGKGVTFAGESMTIVGVLPAGFQLYFPPDANVPASVPVFTPFPFDVAKGRLTVYFIRLLTRLKPGVSLREAQQDLDAVAAHLRAAYTEFAAENVTFKIVSMHADAIGDMRPAVLLVFSGAALVLLICCVNIMNLLLGRARDRLHEIAVRTALGASRPRILRQLLAEAFVLCAISTAVGLALGWACVRILKAIRPERLAQLGDIRIDWPVLLFMAAISLAATVVFGLAPAIESTRSDLTGTFREQRAVDRGRRGLRPVLIVSEVALGFMLVVGAGLMLRTLANIRGVRPGFDPAHLLTFELELSELRMPARINFINEWEAALRSLPGVQSAGSVSHLPLDDYPNWYGSYRPAGMTEDQAAGLLADYRSITPGYLHAMGARLLEGRAFEPRDREEGALVAIIDDLMARSTWPGQSAIGKRIESEHFTRRGFVEEWSTVVGVIEHVRTHSLSNDLRAQIYVPFEQSPRWHMSFVVRTSGDSLALAPAIRRKLAALNPVLAVSKLRPMTDFVEREISPASFTAVLTTTFAALALTLAGIGIYGLLYYTVSRRAREIGVRMALGATRRDVIVMVMREGMTLLAAGVILGVAGSMLVSRSLAALVYGVSALDPPVYLIALVLLPLAGLLGCWRPARRAALANPIEAIRAE